MNRLKNPIKKGVIIVETISGETKCYMGQAPIAEKFKVYERENGGNLPWKNGFNPKKIAFFGDEIIIYAKNMTLSIDREGVAKTMDVIPWDGNE